MVKWGEMVFEPIFQRIHYGIDTLLQAPAEFTKGIAIIVVIASFKALLVEDD
jgi:hypothetical protein